MLNHYIYNNNRLSVHVQQMLHVLSERKLDMEWSYDGTKLDHNILNHVFSFEDTDV